jgi:hypothetical protein
MRPEFVKGVGNPGIFLLNTCAESKIASMDELRKGIYFVLGWLKKKGL